MYLQRDSGAILVGRVSRFIEIRLGQSGNSIEIQHLLKEELLSSCQ